MTYEEWYSNLTTEDKYVFNQDGSGYLKDRSVMMLLAFNAGYRAGMEQAIEACKEQEDALSEDGYTLINLGAGNCAKAIRAELDK